MGFLNPYMLWGMLVVALPVIIHFWYQKKGKQIAWAASQWLIDKTSLKHRGIRLDEIPLLLLRCLLVILLALLLSKPIGQWLGNDPEKGKIHLVQANAKVVNNFRFEIENALKRKEKVFWIADHATPLTGLNAVSTKDNTLTHLQQSINFVADASTSLNLYLVNSQKISQLPKIYVPGNYKLNTVADSAGKVENPLIGLNKKIGRENVAVLVDYKNPDEATTVKAGLGALTAVFNVSFHIDEQPKLRQHYDWVLTDKPVLKPNPQTLYVMPAQNSGMTVSSNIVQTSDSLLLATSDMVQNGQLPEWLGQMLIKHYQLEKSKSPLSDKQLAAHFGNVKFEKQQASGALQQWLMLFFVLTLFAERWISLNQKANRNYA